MPPVATPPPATTAPSTPAETEAPAQATATTTPAAKPNAACDTPPSKEAPPTFEAMMATQLPIEADATLQLDAAPKLPDTEVDAAPAPMQPDQLLALLAGSQAIAAAPTPAPPQTSVPTQQTDAPTARATPLALPLPAAPQPQAASTAAPIIEATKPTAASTPDLATTDNNNAPSFDALLTNVSTPAIASHPTPVTRAEVLAQQPLAMPLDPDAGFDDGFGARIGWMAGEKIGHAQIRISPADLGPIDVRVQVEGTRVNAEFHSAHVEVRQALEASVPRLREMLGQQGLQLGHADVGHRRPDAQPAPREDARAAANDDAPTPQTVRPLMRSRGLLDEYA